MQITTEKIRAFASEIRRLRTQAEPTLYPAYQALIRDAYTGVVHVDSNRRVSGVGFPDLTVSRGALLLNWIEIKPPDVRVDALPAVDQERFDRYREGLPHVVLTNGWHWQLFEQRRTNPQELRLPQGWLMGSTSLTRGEEEQLIQFLRILASLSPSMAVSDTEAIELIATAARLIRSAVLDLPSSAYPPPLARAYESFTILLRTNPADPTGLEPGDFADVLAQTATFGYLLARIEAGTDVSPATAATTLSTVEHPFLNAALHGLIAPDVNLEAALKGVLVTACDMVNRAATRLAGPNGDWRNVPYVYEDFFAVYRPEDRFKYGIFYTDETITNFQVRQIAQTLREEFGLSGLLDSAVRFLDPACGTGTYLLALAEGVESEARATGAAVGTALQELFTHRLVGFEVSPGPACVAQVRLEAWLRARGVRLGSRFPIYTVNTLAPPVMGAATATGNIWQDSVSRERVAGDTVKAVTPVLVIFGNPPWGTRPQEVFETGERNLIAPWATGAAGAVISLYDLYVAFWRFAFDMLLERPGVQEPKGIVSYITNRSWLRGKAYSQIRAWLRSRNVTASIFDLGGDIRAGADRGDEGVFAIQAGSAIATLSFGGALAMTGTTIRYARLRGRRAEKLAALEAPTPPLQVDVDHPSMFAPIDWGTLENAPSIDRFFAVNYPGVKTHRDELVIDVERDSLLSKISAWNALEGSARDEPFLSSRVDRTTGQRRRDLPTPAEGYRIDPPFIMLHRYRPLDDRYLYNDRRFITRSGTISRYYDVDPETTCLISMDSRTGPGPVVIATNHLPGYNSFRGSYETHAFPLAPKPGGLLAAASDPLTRAARTWLAQVDPVAGPVEVGAYLLALGNACSYAATFAEAMEAEIVRFPATLDPRIFAEAVEVGRLLHRAWCLQSPPVGVWRQVAPGVPLGQPAVEGATVTFANGDRLEGLHPSTASFVVSDYPVMQRFLEARSHLALTSTLDLQIRTVAGAIKVIVEAQPKCDDLLQRIVSRPTGTF